MRFLANGPNIPDTLLDARDDGSVVFLCGAGVSIPAGMPDFAGLTERVLDQLNPPRDSQIREAFSPWKWTSCPKDEGRGVPVSARTPLDHIFNSLQADYGPETVNGVVADILAQPANSKASQTHDIISRLSKGADGVPQIVTTNFDLLFEKIETIKHCKDHGMVFEPPTFPNLLHDQAVSGLTYLHGRLQAGESRRHEYILSSADFGRAYLAEGWATAFVVRLLERYTVVLLGYQADDPPMSYLLQGLSKTAKRASNRLYAFDAGAPGDVDAKWRDRGVTPIPYPNDGKDHVNLWKSLEAWAVRADDPEAWRARIVERAREGPRSLSSHERGQVAHVVRTTRGARAFAAAAPPIPSEWICVFDRARRLAAKVSNPSSNDTFDPRAFYALDDDPSERSGIEQLHENDEDDLIAGRSEDGRLDPLFRLAKTHAVGEDELPARLRHIGSWLAANSGDPIVAWWAANKRRLHPWLASKIAEHIEHREDISERARNVWTLIFEDFENSEFRHPFIKWRKARRRVARDGWIPRTLREVERLTEPVVKIVALADTDLRRVKPPPNSWSKVTLRDIANFTVEFPDQNEGTGLVPDLKPLDVPDKDVCALFSLASRNLIRGLERLTDVYPGELDRNLDITHIKLRNVKLFADTADTGRPKPSPPERYVLWVAELMERAAAIDPVRMAATVALWPSGEFYVLNKLRLLAWNQASVYSGREVADRLVELDRCDFWSRYDERELLLLIQSRWEDLSKSEQKKILERILDGPISNHDEESGEGRDSLNTRVLIRLRWIEKNGCVLPSDVSARATEIQQALPDWDESKADRAVRTPFNRRVSVDCTTDPSIFDGVEISEIVNVALQHTGRRNGDYANHQPYEGLVKSDPARALAGLEFAARNCDFPKTLWTTIFHRWPHTASLSATKELSCWIQKLPDDVINANAIFISAWMEANLPTIAAKDLSLAIAVFDDFLLKLECEPPDEANCDYVEMSVSSNGRFVKPSRRTSHYAIASSVGLMTGALTSMLAAQDDPRDHETQHEFASRLERLLAAPGIGSDHAICVMAQQLGWLHEVYPDWVRTSMLPCFKLDHTRSEPAWSGFLNGDWESVTPPLFEAIKTPFLELFPKMYEWRWVDGIEFSRAHEWLVQSAIQHCDDARFTSPTEAMTAIREASAIGRTDMIQFLAEVGQDMHDGWLKRVIPFLRHNWPRENKFQTEETVGAFLSVLSLSGESFPDVFGAARAFLRPANLAYCSFYELCHVDHDGDEPIAQRFPLESLNLVDSVVSCDPNEAPTCLDEVLAMIAVACPNLRASQAYVRLSKLLAES